VYLRRCKSVSNVYINQYPRRRHLSVMLVHPYVNLSYTASRYAMTRTNKYKVNYITVNSNTPALTGFDTPGTWGCKLSNGSLLTRSDNLSLYTCYIHRGVLHRLLPGFHTLYNSTAKRFTLAHFTQVYR
jgi:hypothetical protein